MSWDGMGRGNQVFFIIGRGILGLQYLSPETARLFLLLPPFLFLPRTLCYAQTGQKMLFQMN